jgi:tetratricopeptide (TPR) repeat protein/transcriptional regulator with XRE-family HTH domain
MGGMGDGAQDRSLAVLIRRHRIAARLTQEELADRAGVSVRTIRGLEGGRVLRPRRDSIRLLSDALQLSAGHRRELEEVARVAAWAGIHVDAPPPRAGPAQLPPDVADFTGRDRTVAALRDALTEDADTRRATPVLAVAGRGGVGKTALGVHVAHLVAHRFPDGQLLVDLRGAEEHPRSAGDVLARFLRALGVEDPAIPEDPDDRRDLYRSTVRGRRLLVVLDNAADEAQVRPLLPGEARCGVLVTSRWRLLGLEGARHHDIDVLARDEALVLLSRVAGRAQLVGDQDADEVVEYCGRLPLAIRIAGARLGASGEGSPRWLRDRLADEHRRLDELSAGDLEVRASAALSHRALDPQARRLFGLLGLLAAERPAGWVAAALMDLDPAVADGVLERLVDASLLDVADRGPAGVHYRFHNLLRLYARERAEAEEPADAVDAALDRALGAWLALSEEAEPGLPDTRSVRTPGAAPRWRLPPTSSRELVADPVAWFETEWPAIVVAVDQAAALGRDELAWELVAGVATFFMLRSRWEPWRAVYDTALRACVAAGNRRGEAHLLLGESTRLLAAADHDRALDLGERALGLLEGIGDRRGEGRALAQLAQILARTGRSDEALQRAGLAAQLALEIGDRDLEADAKLYAGRALLQLGRTQPARRTLTEFVKLAERAGARRAQAQGYWQLAAVQRADDDLPGAARLLERALAIVRELSDGAGEGRVLVDLAGVEEQRGRVAEAVAALRAAAAIGASTGTIAVAADAAAGLARLDPD